MSLGDGPEFKLAGLCSQLEWWLESSMLMSVGQEGGASGKEAERRFWGSQNDFSGLHHLALTQSYPCGMWLSAQVLDCLGPNLALPHPGLDKSLHCTSVCS